MSDATVLALVAPDTPGIAPETIVLGLPMIRRTALAARRAGFDRVGRRRRSARRGGARREPAPSSR